ncbi:MAG: ComEA family DNA-binding protein [Tenacibaculum sp.]
MNIFKHPFFFDKAQRNGAFFLVLLIVVMQIVYIFGNFANFQSNNTASEFTAQLQVRLDSLQEEQNRQKNISRYKIYPFNPNYITDFKGYQLGMSTDEIDRLHNFRKQNKYVNSKQEFQSVTKVSDSLLLKIAPYFKFPAWVEKRFKNKIKKEQINKLSKTLAYNAPLDINKATAIDFIKMFNLENKLAYRIVKYRKKLQGFSFEQQLNEVWGLSQEKANAILKIFKILEKPKINKININSASFKEVLKTPYIDYKLCKMLFDYKEEVAKVQTIEELKNIAGFPLNKYDKIILYLEAK